MASIIIAAHNEAEVLGAQLDALREGTSHSPLEVIVVPNGCTDNTAEVARARSFVRVIEVTEAGKAVALNAGDRAATSHPRIYLDADINVPPGGIDALVEALSEGFLAAVPGRRLELEGRPWLVRAYFAINERLPVYHNGLFGRGLIALSAAGRARFDTFPLMVADDLFLDSLFSPTEKTQVSGVEVVVETPHTTRDLLRRLTRVRRGNAAMRAAGKQGTVAASVRPADRWSWLRDVVVPQPHLAAAGIAYATLSLISAVMARRGPVTSLAWGQDASSRRARNDEPAGPAA